MAFPNAIESGIFALWGGKQAARGTPAVTADKKLRQVAGALAIQRAIASENFGDGERFANGMDYTDTLTGGGDPSFEGQAGAGAWLVAQSLGQDSYAPGTPPTDPGTHTLTPSNAGARWLTFWKTVGSSVPNKEQYNDSKISQLVILSSAAQKVLRLTPTIMSLDPGIVYATDPLVVDDNEDPFLWTQSHGTFNIDARGVGVITEISELTITINDGLNPWYGEDIRVNSLVPSRGTISVAFTMLITDGTMPIYNLIHYGTETPAVGALPINTVHYGSIDMNMSFGTGPTLRKWKQTIPKVRYATDVAVAGAVDGGPIEMAIGGEGRKLDATTPMLTIAVTNGDSTAY
jgi:hypothetical protein